MEKCYCPICGHEYKQGEYEINYETGNTDYHCPECEHDCIHTDVISASNVSDKLEDMKFDYDLEGVEISDEDVNLVISKVIDEGEDYEEALKSVLFGIADCLEDGADEIDLSDKLEMYDGGYDQEELDNNGLCVVAWPDSQALLTLPEFWEHSKLINDEEGLDAYGSSAYVVEKQWYLEQFC